MALPAPRIRGSTRHWSRPDVSLGCLRDIALGEILPAAGSYFCSRRWTGIS